MAQERPTVSVITVTVQYTHVRNHWRALSEALLAFDKLSANAVFYHG